MKLPPGMEESQRIGKYVILAQLNVISDSFRLDDMLARLGSDKLGVLLPNTGSVFSDAVQTCVRNRLVNYNQQHHSPPLAITMSSGSVENGQSVRGKVLRAKKRLTDTKSSR